MTGSTDEKSRNPEAVQENPELLNENINTDSTSDSKEKNVAPTKKEENPIELNTSDSTEVTQEAAPLSQPTAPSIEQDLSEESKEESPILKDEEENNTPASSTEASTTTEVSSDTEEEKDKQPDSSSDQSPILKGEEENNTPASSTEVTITNEESSNTEEEKDKQPDSSSDQSNTKAGKSHDNDHHDNDHHDDDHHEDEHEEEIDYSAFGKKALTEALADLSNEEYGFKKSKKISLIKASYDVIFQKERAEAKEKFIAEGSSADDFQYKLDETSIKFEAYHKILREKRSKNAKEQEKQKEHNLELKNALLERLREFVDNDENTSSINELKKMQEEWKNIGPVHHQHNRSLWANYNALMDRYYDHRSIYFELKELDRKKNLEAKQELCKQAEMLDALENLNAAIKKLNELHEEYKHIGPVPKETQEETWQRFKTASDKIYAKRKDYVSHLKEELSENYEKKSALADKVAEFAGYTSSNIGEWNAKTKELLAIQKEWEAIGAMPKDQAKSVNKKFWGDFKSFFHNKSAFFKTLDSQREENLKLKKELVDKAVALQESEDWEETAKTYKNLQKEWKDIGPVPGKEREKIYKKFKAACDEFFNRKRGHSKDMESSYDDNLKKKEAICESLEALIGAEDLHPEQVYELQDAYSVIGFVPKKAIKAIQNRYQEALNNIIARAKDFDEDELSELKSLVRINKMKSGPHGDHKLHRKEHSLKRKIQSLEKDVSTWKNNLSFFAKSKTANDMLKDFEEKIKKAEDELVELKEELKLITYAEH